MMGKLKGYKTYIVAGVTIIGAVANYLIGDVSLQDTLHFVVDAVLAACLRNGVSNSKGA